MQNRLLLIAAALIGTTADAEAPPKPNGIRIGEGRLHPYLSVRAAYDSAAGYFPTGTSGALSTSGDFVVTPNLGLAFNLDTGSTLVNFNGSAGFVWYTGLVSSSARNMSFITSTVGLDAQFNKTGAVEFQIGDQFSRSNHSGNVAAAIGVLGLFNSAYVAVPIHPGGGAIVVTPKVRWDVEFFSPQLPSRLPDCGAGGRPDITCDPNLVSRMNYSNLNFGLGGKWKFLPKTAVVLDATFDYRTYFNTTPPTPGMAPDTSTNLNGLLLRVMGGLSGLITSRISVLALIGGGGDFAGSGAATVLAQAEAAYLGQDVTARLGYLRNLSPVPVFGTFGQDRGYAEVKATFFGRLGLRAFGAFDLISYYAQARRSDYVVTALGEVSYQILSFLSAALSYNLSWRSSSTGMSGVSYTRHEPALTVTLSY